MGPKDKEKFLSWLLKGRAGYDMNWEAPKTFNEKLNYLKLYYHNPFITACADKYKVREIIKSKIGEKYLVPLLGVWKKPSDIDFDKLPERFVLKANWGSSQNIIVKNKADLDIKKTRKTLEKWIQPDRNNYLKKLEWAYKNIPPMIIAEEYIEKLDTGLICYKVFCFNGEPKIFQVVYDDKQKHSTLDYFDLNWQKLPIEQEFPNNPNPCKAPKTRDKMIEIARTLSASLPFVRVDLYDIDDEVFFSECTFYSYAGLAPFKPEKWDRLFGDMLQLPADKLMEECEF